MAWIQSDIQTYDDARLKILRRRLGWSKVETIGFWQGFQWAILKYSPMGVVSGVPIEVLAEELDFSGELLGKSLGLLKELGLTEERQGKIVIVGWLKLVRIYLRDTLYKNDRESWLAVNKLYGESADSMRTIRKPSADDPQTIGGISVDIPTNQPTHTARREKKRWIPPEERGGGP